MNSSTLMNHAFYAVVRPHDCLCEMCLGKRSCGEPGCKKKAKLPIKDKSSASSYTAYCLVHSIKAAKKLKEDKCSPSERSSSSRPLLRSSTGRTSSRGSSSGGDSPTISRRNRS